MKKLSLTPEFDMPDVVIERASRVALLILDVDGVLTDGSLDFSDASHQSKSFHARDGLGLKMLATHGVELAIITSRNSTLVADRAAELGISHLYQGRSNKLGAYEELVAATGVDTANTGYVGDDLVDLPVMTRVGFAAAVSDADHVVRQVAHWTTPLAGGRGAVRQVCELILYARGDYERAIREFLDSRQRDTG